MLAIDNVAALIPGELGSKVTWKVVLAPPAIGDDGRVVTEKSTALVPLIMILGLPVKSKLLVPVLLMVKVRTIDPLSISVLPKSVKSAVDGVVSPLTIEIPFP